MTRRFSYITVRMIEQYIMICSVPQFYLDGAKNFSRNGGIAFHLSLDVATSGLPLYGGDPNLFPQVEVYRPNFL